MRIKKFKAKTLNEGKELVLSELGGDAVILSSRTAQSPSGSSYIEIVAAIDNAPAPSPIKKSISKQTPQVKTSLPTVEAEGMDKNNDFIQAASQIYTELGALKDMVLEVSESVKFKYSGVLGKVYGQLFKELRKADISESLALKIVGTLTSRIKDTSLNEAVAMAREEIVKGLEFLPPAAKPEKRKIAAFIGATGSGKTLTLVKLAVISKLVLKADVFLISADTQKVGGAEQLQTFASIATIPFQAVYSADEFRNIFDREINRDLIFIDTIGCSQKDAEKISEIEEYLEAANPDITYLVQNAIAGKTTMAQAIRNFATLKPNAMILTHLDEAATYGAVAEVLGKYALPLAYFTNGQRIPDDIEPATKEALGYLILPKTIVSESNV